MLEIKLAVTAQRFIKKSTRQEQVATAQRITELSSDPVTGCIKCVNYDVHRAVVRQKGVELRILFTYDETAIEILAVVERNDDEVYKWLRNNYQPTKREKNEYGY